MMNVIVILLFISSAGRERIDALIKIYSNILGHQIVSAVMSFQSNDDHDSRIGNVNAYENRIISR